MLSSKVAIDLRVLLDTTALYVFAGASELSFSSRVSELLKNPENEVLVSPLSFQEIAIKASKGLTHLRPEHIQKLILEESLTVLDLTAAHAFRVFGLPPHHGDPFDRMLIATALAEDVAIVARDREFTKYKGLRVIW